ncbi:ATPase subunit 4 [Cucumis melo var. makuwa]|uniref:ATPase subunit 4 (Mitochondrion) n=1 Tax=Cucumis melo var. makuwa TaxID=1194695 RepID=A0A5D3E2L1_CUCMM|nr:ATPase subunit 4 [Cucumis melo var. makuwa]TYK30038.1 ATPase subunit 4 [Cucumis melo var. makuwa]
MKEDRAGKTRFISLEQLPGKKLLIPKEERLKALWALSATLPNATYSCRIHLQDDLVTGFHLSMNERFVLGCTLKSSIVHSHRELAFKRIDLKGIHQTWPLFLSRSEKSSTERSLNSLHVESIRKESRIRHMKRTEAYKLETAIPYQKETEGDKKEPRFTSQIGRREGSERIQG